MPKTVKAPKKGSKQFVSRAAKTGKEDPEKILKNKSINIYNLITLTQGQVVTQFPIILTN